MIVRDHGRHDELRSADGWLWWLRGLGFVERINLFYVNHKVKRVYIDKGACGLVIGFVEVCSELVGVDARDVGS